MIYFEFNEKKTTQAAAFLIKLSSENTINYTKLIKLLYLADEKALKEWERPISGDSYFSMGRGPILSKTLDLIHYPDDSFWHRFIKKSDYDVCLAEDPGDYSLTPNEKRILSLIWDEHKDRDWRDMIKFCHDCCEEWQHPGETSIPIHIEDILKSLGRTEREIEIIEEEVLAVDYAKRIFRVA